MRIAMIGTGYVGLVSGACFSDFGHEVTCVDRNAAIIDTLAAGKVPIYEPGLDQVIARNAASEQLKFTTELKEAVSSADAVFIAVGTPSRRGDGFADLQYVHGAAEEIAAALRDYTVVITKSTVPVGTCRELEHLIRKARPDAEFDMASNPEFLREGSAVEDFMRPDRVVIGAESERARQVLRGIYRPLYLRETPVVMTGLETAELIKYASNAFLAAKITFINEMADVCENVGADVRDVAKAMGLDGRIGNKFLHPGPGYGGSCFPKDTQALVRISEIANAPTGIVKAVVEANARRKARMSQKIIEACGGSVNGKTIAILGVTFKPNTDDMRDAPSLDVIPALQEAGAIIRANDPAGMEIAAKIFEEVTWCDTPYLAMDGADMAVILTEWNAFRALDLERIKAIVKSPVVVDLRNIYDPREMADAGIDYYCIGRALEKPRSDYAQALQGMVMADRPAAE